MPQPGWALCRSSRRPPRRPSGSATRASSRRPTARGSAGSASSGTPPTSSPPSRRRRRPRARVCIVERYATGREVTVNAFSVDGRFHPLTVTDREVSPSRRRSASRSRTSGRACSRPRRSRGRRRRAAPPRRSESRTGRRTRRCSRRRTGPRVVELAARLGGGHDAELCRAALGVDLNGLALAAALGEPIAPSSARARGPGRRRVRALPRRAAGRARSVTGLEEARGGRRGRLRRASTGARATCSARSAAAPTARAPSSRWARRATRRSSGRRRRPASADAPASSSGL